jgi:hypothetical protein
MVYLNPTMINFGQKLVVRSICTSLKNILVRVRLEVLETSGNYTNFSELDEDNAEYLVPIEWITSLPMNNAFSETGLFGNQNSVCKPTTLKWSHTIDRLKV